MWKPARAWGRERAWGRAFPVAGGDRPAQAETPGVARNGAAVVGTGLGILTLGALILGALAFGVLALGALAFGVLAFDVLALGVLPLGVLAFRVLAFGVPSLGVLGLVDASARRLPRVRCAPQGCHTYRTSGSRSSLPLPSVRSTATKPCRS